MILMSEEDTSTSDNHLKSAQQREQKKNEQRDDLPFFVFTRVFVIVLFLVVFLGF